MSELFSGYAVIGEALAGVRSRFADALAGAGEGPHRIGLTVDGTELRVDQLRGIANTVGGPDNWTEREGRRLMRNDNRQGRIFLSYVVGSERYLSARDFEEILMRICAAQGRPVRETDVAQFVNMVAAEPIHEPRSEIAVWATAAHKLATGLGHQHFTPEIPELATSYDPLYAEIPAGADFAEALLPESSRPRAPTLERYTALLAAEVSAPGGERELEAYVRKHLLARVAQALS